MTSSVSKLGDAIDLLSGFAFAAELFNEDSGMPLVRIRDVVRGFSETRFSGVVDEAFIVKNGEILVGMDGNFNAARWRGGPALLNQRVCRLRARANILDDGYLFHLLPRALKKIEDATAFVTVKHLSVKGIRDIDIDLPPLPEQRRIAAILDQAEALRAKRREALAQLDSLTQSIFIEMFGDPVTNPKGFTRKSLGEIIKFEGGSQPPASTFTDEEAPDTIRLVQIRDFKTDRFKTFIPKKLSRRFFEIDDVMIGRYGPPVFQILRGLSGSYNVALMKAVPRDGITKDFVFHLLKENHLHNFVVSNSERTAGQSGVNLELLEKYEAYMPPIDLQREFVARISVLNSVTIYMRESLAELDKLFASLQHRAFRGELQMNNFASLQSEWPNPFGAALKAQGMANTDSCTTIS